MNAAGRQGHVLCVGRLYCDLIFTGMEVMPKLGEECFANDLALHAGGGAYITAAYFSSLGRATSLCSTLPAEPFGTVVMNEIARSGVDYSYCSHSGLMQTIDPQITVAMAQGGDRAFLTRRVGTALPDVDLSRILKQIPELCHVHIGELTTALEYPQLIQIAQSVGLTVSLDCGWDEQAFGHSDVQALVESVDVFLPNHAEVDCLLSHGVVLDRQPLCVVKNGAQGASIGYGNDVLKRSACQVDVLDTTGAGDAFNAGFIHSWLNDEALSQCLYIGNSCGASAVGRVGGTAGLFSAAEVF